MQRLVERQSGTADETSAMASSTLRRSPWHLITRVWSWPHSPHTRMTRSFRLWTRSLDPREHNPTGVSLEPFGPDSPPGSTQVLGSRVAVPVRIATGRLRGSILARRPGHGGTMARRHSIRPARKWLRDAVE
jgi:hypothetical protein